MGMRGTRTLSSVVADMLVTTEPQTRWAGSALGSGTKMLSTPYGTGVAARASSRGRERIFFRA